MKNNSNNILHFPTAPDDDVEEQFGGDDGDPPYVVIVFEIQHPEPPRSNGWLAAAIGFLFGLSLG
jgi:hypothetical protein